MRIFFRADGGPAIGWGHLYRCLALAEMLDEAFDVFFLLKDAPKSFTTDLEARQIAHRFIADDREIESLLGHREDILVLDGYSFSLQLQTSLRQVARLVCVDDLADGLFDADLIINHCPGVRKEDYKVTHGNTRFALGLDYALLRKDFLEAATHRRDCSSMDRLLICFGGADPLNLTYSTLANIHGSPEVSHIDVVVGGSYAFSDSIASFADDRIVLHQNLSARAMVEVMRNNDIAVVSSSSILFECVALGLRCLSLPYVDNQKRIHHGFVSMGLTHSISTIDRIDAELRAFVGSGQTNSRSQVIDGRSGKRLLREFKLLSQ